MIVLAIDTALDVCAAAIAADERVLARGCAPGEVSRSDALAPLVAALLEGAGLRPAQIGRIGVVVGPGGFAGVRAGLSFARAFGFALGAPIVGVDTMAALAASESDRGGQWIAPTVDARRGQIYAGLYDGKGREALAPFVAEPDEAVKHLAAAAGGFVGLFGSGAPFLPELPNGWTIRHDRAEIDILAVARLAAHAERPERPPAPLYLRPPDAVASSGGIFAGLSGLTR